MKPVILLCILGLLTACSAPNFVIDVPSVPVSSEVPDHFELPARFAFARTVYGRLQPARKEEAALWEDLALRAKDLGVFSPLISGDLNPGYTTTAQLVESARRQRYRYVILLQMHPETGAADIVLLHAGSGGVMATANAVSPTGGRRGFFGGRITNGSRLDRVTLTIAKSAAPVLEEMLLGAAMRQDR